MQSRLTWIDIAKGISILCIVFGHVIVNSTQLYELYKLFLSFNVVIFFILSGITFKVNIRFERFLIKKIFRFLIPYFIFSFIFLIPFFLFGQNVSDDFNQNVSFDLKQAIIDIFYGVGENNRLKQNSPLWFLPALFSTELIYYFICKLDNRINYKTFSFIFLIFLFIISFFSTKLTLVIPFGFNSVLQIGPFFYLGFIFNKYILNKKEILFEKKYFSLIIGVFLIGLSIPFIYLNDTINCKDYLYGNYIYFLIESLFMSSGIILISYFICSNFILELLGRYSLEILLIHKIFIVLFQTKFGYFSTLYIDGSLILQVLLSLCVFIFTICISFFISVIMKYYIPFIYGYFLKKSNYKISDFSNVKEEKLSVLYLEFPNTYNIGGIQKFVGSYISFFKNISAGIIASGEKVTMEEFWKEKEIPVYHAPSKFHILKYIKFLRRTMNDYDVIHINKNSLINILTFVVAHFDHKFIVCHSHNTTPTKKTVFSFLHYVNRKYILDNCNLLFACSRLAAAWMYGKKIGRSERVYIVNNAIDLEKYRYKNEIRNEIRTKYGINDNYVFGHVGRFSEQKNHKFLIDVFSEVSKERNDIKLFLVGTGPLFDTIKDYVNEKKIADKVIFVGLITNIEDYYMAMDSFIFPSLFEGLPISVIEAQASGLRTIISSNITNEVILSNLVKSIDLSKRHWIEEMEELLKSSYERDNDIAIRCLTDKGYSIVEESKKLENVYFNAFFDKN